MKTIKTLITDIQKRLTSTEPYEEAAVAEFTKNLTKKLVDKLCTVQAPSLRLSNLGTPCERKLWYSINTPELAEPLSASARMKFLFGDIIEDLVLFLARASGHTVSDEQKEVSVNGVRGHIDGIVDGELVDAKSASTPGFAKFRDHGLEQSDDFGYLDQLGGYSHALNLHTGHFLAVDKQLGKICLDTYEFGKRDYDALVDQKRAMLASTTPPPRFYPDLKDGESGNRKLGVACSYCPFKATCWPGLRIFMYSGRYGRSPRFLTKVVFNPGVPEVKLHEVET